MVRTFILVGEMLRGSMSNVLLKLSWCSKGIALLIASYKNHINRTHLSKLRTLAPERDGLP